MSSSEVDKILDSLRDQKWRVVDGKGSHVLAYPPRKDFPPVTVAVNGATNANRRGLKGLRSKLRASGWVDPYREGHLPKQKRRALPPAIKPVAAIAACTPPAPSSALGAPGLPQEPAMAAVIVQDRPGPDVAEVHEITRAPAIQTHGKGKGKPMERVVEVLLSDGTNRYECIEGDYKADSVARVMGHLAAHRGAASPDTSGMVDTSQVMETPKVLIEFGTTPTGGKTTSILKFTYKDDGRVEFRCNHAKRGDCAYTSENKASVFAHTRAHGIAGVQNRPGTPPPAAKALHAVPPAPSVPLRAVPDAPAAPVVVAPAPQAVQEPVSAPVVAPAPVPAPEVLPVAQTATTARQAAFEEAVEMLRRLSEDADTDLVAEAERLRVEVKGLAQENERLTARNRELEAKVATMAEREAQFAAAAATMQSLISA